MSNPDLQTLKAPCETIKNDAAAAWTWDDQFDAVLAQLDEDDATKVVELVANHFPPPWNVNNLPEAPTSVQQIAEYFGGLWPNQKLFVTDLSQPAALVAALWPWESDARLSLRFVIWSEKIDEATVNEALKSWFGI